MSKKRTFEWWAIDNLGFKHNAYITSSSRKPSKVKALISATFDIDIETCKDFGMREIFSE